MDYTESKFGQYGRYLFLLAILLFSLSIFYFILSNPILTTIKNAIQRGSENILLLFVPLVILTICFQRKGILSHFYGFIMLSVFYALLLAWHWNSGFSITTHLWGYLPTSDAGSYFIEAVGLIAGDKITSTAANRPLFTLLLSSLLLITNLNPMIVLGVLAYANVLSSYIAANEIRKTHGAFAAAVYLSFGILFYRLYIGTIMTEQLGFLLGNLAFAFFWNGIRHSSLSKVLLGLFALSLGLNVRAGAMFILLTIPVWVGLFFGPKRFSLKLTGVALAIAISGFVINFLATSIFLPKDTRMFSNFGLTLYGVAVGNKGWDQILKDYPGITTSETTAIAIQQIKRDPIRFAKGIALTYLDYINPQKCNAYCFLTFSSPRKKVIILLLALIGSFYIVFKRRRLLESFLAYSLLGIILSVPFAPTIDVGYRTYTVTNPILASLIFVTFPWVSRTMRKIFRRTMVSSPRLTDNEDLPFWNTSNLLLVTIIAFMILPLFMVQQPGFYYQPPDNSCEEGQIPVGLWTNRDAWIHVVPQGNLPQGVMIPNITSANMNYLAEKSSYHAVRNFLDAAIMAVPGNSVGWLPYNYFEKGNTQSMKGQLLVINTEDLPDKFGFLSLCVISIPPTFEEGTFIRVSTATNLRPAQTVGSTATPIQHKSRFTFAIIAVFVTGMLFESGYSFIRDSKVNQWLARNLESISRWIKN